MPFKIKPDSYTVWQSMKHRCLYPSSKQYKDYGGRGIKICDRWLHSFQAFAEDMGPRPEGAVIDRIDNNGNYEPGNCRWATRKESQRNRRNTAFVTIEGVSYKVAELAEQSGLKGDTIIQRAEKGLSYYEVMDPKRKYNLTGLSLGGMANGAAQRAMTHCKRGHPFDAVNTMEGSKPGTRMCRSCYAWRKGLKNAPYPIVI